MKSQILNTPVLIDDVAVAALVSMSRSWVRAERFNRRHGLPHIFTLNPVMVGSSPRYRLEDVENWISCLADGDQPVANGRGA